VQAIGAVNEKIEGFFDVCQQRGLSGSQGVLIPAANVKHLMLRHDVVAAAQAGQFHIYAVAQVDQAIALLTGLEAGALLPDGSYPPGSLNHLVAARVLALREIRKAHAQALEKKPQTKDEPV
jgi:predicted ATP-dependent protease